jgi:hypothetical protein
MLLGAGKTHLQKLKISSLNRRMPHLSAITERQLPLAVAKLKS